MTDPEHAPLPPDAMFLQDYPQMSCAAMGGVCTADSVCPAGLSAGNAFGETSVGKPGDCLDGHHTCCGSAQQLWAQKDVLVIDVPSTSSDRVPDAPRDDQLTEIRLAAEFRLVLHALGEPLGSSEFRIPLVPITRHVLRAGEKAKPPTRPAGYQAGGFVALAR
jgi:hypothetical protein